MSVYLVGETLTRFNIGIDHFKRIGACSWWWYVTIAAVLNVGHDQLLRQTDSSRFLISWSERGLRINASLITPYSRLASSRGPFSFMSR